MGFNHRMKIFFILLTGIMIRGFCQPAPCPAETLFAALPEAPSSLDPHQTTDPRAWPFIYPCYHRLTAFKGDSTRVVPSLAVTWRISDDGRLYTFILNKELTFSDGQVVDAQAVRASFYRAYRLGVAGPEYFPGLTDVRVLGPYTVRFYLEYPMPYLLQSLAMPAASIVSPGVVDHPPGYLDRQTLGSGPYKLEEFRPGEMISLTLRGDQPVKPKVDRFTTLFSSDPQQGPAWLKQGNVQIAAGLSARQLSGLIQDPALTVYSTETFHLTYLAVNTQRHFLDRREVRRALSLAIDYQGLIDKIRPGGAERMFGPIPFKMWGRRDDLERFDYDPAAARRIINLNEPIQRPLTLLYEGEQAAPAEFLTANIEAVGLAVDPTPCTGSEFQRLIEEGEFDLTLVQTAVKVAEPGHLLARLFHSARSGRGGNTAHYHNPRVDRLIQEAYAAGDRDHRLSLYYRIQNLVVEDAPYIFLVQDRIQVGLSKRIKNFSLHPIMPLVFPLTTLKLDPVRDKGVTPDVHKTTPSPKSRPRERKPAADPETKPRVSTPKPPGWSP